MAITKPEIPPRARLTSQGQITVPKALRDALGAKAGDELEFVRQADGFLIRHRPRVSVLDFAGIASAAASRVPKTAEELDNFLEAAGAARAIARNTRLQTSGGTRQPRGRRDA